MPSQTCGESADDEDRIPSFKLHLRRLERGRKDIHVFLKSVGDSSAGMSLARDHKGDWQVEKIGRSHVSA